MRIKALSAAIAVCTTLLFAVPAGANTETQTNEVAILSDLGILQGDTNGDLMLDKALTRAEFATLVVRILNNNETNAGSGATSFTDVPYTHWASGSIAMCEGLGYINGFPDGTFQPESPILYEQAVKIIVSMLGYTPKAEANGGYPTGYLMIATQKGITKGINGKAGDVILRKDLAKLIYNSLEVNLMEQTVFTKGAEEYAETNNTILKSYLGLEKIESLITNANLASTLDTRAKTTVTFGDVKGTKATDETLLESAINVGKTNAALYRGYWVIAYVGENEETGDNEIFAITPKNTKNNIITFSSNDLMSYDTNEIEYIANENDKYSTRFDIDIDKTAFYVNNAADYETAQDILTERIADECTYTFIDYDGNDTYDFVFITLFGESMVVDEIDDIGLRIYGIEGETFYFEDNVAYSIIKNNEYVSINTIKPNDILTFAESYNGKNVTIYISNNVVNGTVSEKTDKNGEIYYTIDEDEYTAKDVTLKIGDEGTFYININNDVVYKKISSGASNGNYAYLLDAEYKNALGGKTLKIKYLTADGKWETAEVAQKFTLYRGSNSSTYDLSNLADKEVAFSNFITVGEGVTPQLFTYAKNSNGYINKIILAGNDSDYFYLDKSNENALFRENTMKLGSVYVDRYTKVFNINTDKLVDLDEDAITVSTVNNVFKDGNVYFVESYDTDLQGNPAILVTFNAKADIDTSNHAFVVSKISEVTNNNGVKVKKFYGYYNGEYIDGIEEVEDGAIIKNDKNVRAGDTILISTDVSGKIDNIEVLINPQTANYFNNWSDDYEGSAFGFAYKKNTNNRLVIDFGDATEEFKLLGADCKFYTVNLNRSIPIVQTASYKDITTDEREGKLGSYVYLRGYDGELLDVIIYQSNN